MVHKCIGILFIIIFLASELYAQQQPSCNCPPVKLYVYDSKIDFPLDSAITDGVYAGAYVQAQNSGEWLEGAYLKQQSDEFKVYKSLRPGAKTGNTYEPPPPDGGSSSDGIDFTSFAEISRNGDSAHYTYTVSIKIFDAYTHNIAISSSQVTQDLGKADDLIDAIITSFSPVLDHLRDYQKGVRDQSGNTKWIGLKWQAIPDKGQLKINTTTNVKIKVFDCADQKPAPDQDLKIEQTNSSTGKLNVTHIKTNSSGEATVIFTAKENGETRVLPDFTFTAVNGKSGYHGTSCDDQKDIVVADDVYKIIMDAENTLSASGEDIKLHGECMAILKSLDDGTYMLEPVDKTRNMNVTVVQNKLVNAGGAVGQIVTPQQYAFPFLFSIGTMDKNSASGKATVYLNTTAPQTGTVKTELTTQGKTVTTIVNIDKGTVTTIAPGFTNTYQLPKGGSMYAMDAITHLNLLSGFMTDISRVKQNTKENIAKAQDQMAWAKRLQAHEHDPAYFKTAQGKADLQQMQALQQQIGGNISNESSTTAGIRQAMTQKMEKDSGYAGSAQFNKDLSRLGFNSDADRYISGKPAMAKVAPGTATVRMEGTFNARSTQAFSGSLENSTGPINTTINIKVEKIN